MKDHLYILGTILFTVYGQVVIKWRIPQDGMLPIELRDKVFFLIKLFFDPFILSGFLAAFVAALCWMAAMTKFDMSYAYPFIGCTYILNFIFAVYLFNELFTWQKLIGNVCILLGIIITSMKIG